jgi:general secretion pathway protein J
MTHRHRDSRGFTLLELLVAMAIFALIGVLAMGGLNSVLGQQEVARRQLDRLHDVQRAMRLAETDFSQISPRSIRDEQGQSTALTGPVVAPCGIEYAVCVSRDGWRNPFARFPRGTLQRAQYRLEDGKLLRSHWAVMDRTLVNEPREEVLLEDVDAFEIAFLDRASTGEWQSQWPPLTAQGTASAGAVLEAVRISVRLRDWGEIVRIVEVIG